MIKSIAIVGFGLTGATAARSLREQGYEGRIHLVGDEPDPAYDRPSLSKSALCGKVESPPLILDEGWTADHDVDVHLGVRVTRIDPAQRCLHLDNGTVIAWDRLLLATGARPRRLPVPGADLDGVLYLRDREDCRRLRKLLGPGVSLAIVGGGLIGCEVATTARKAGTDVCIVEAADELLVRLLGAPVGAWCRQRLEALGVVVQRKVRISGIEGKGGRVCAVTLADGQRMRADVVLVSVGAEPDVALARDAGLDCEGGVKVDANGASSVADIFAAGDVAYWPLRDGGQRSLETYLNSRAQAMTAAAAMLGNAEPSPQIPRAWTEIAGHHIQTIGDIEGPGQRVLRGDVVSGSPLLMLRIVDGQVMAALSVDAAAEFAPATRLVESRLQISPETLSDPAIKLRDLLRKERIAH